MPPRFDEPALERLARAIYDDHVARAMASPGTRSGDGAPASYEALPEEARESYRGQAGDIALKLDMIGATVAPAGDEAPGAFRFTPGQVERLARHEHARWMREKRRAGWRFGPTEDPAARTHPCIVGYERLPDAEKDKDRQIVERIPSLLGAIGLGIARRKTG
jgi:hypothetical protein